MKTIKIDQQQIGYIVEIQSEDGKISGKLTKERTFKNGNIRKKSFSFDPTTILIDMFEFTSGLIIVKGIFDFEFGQHLQYDEKKMLELLYDYAKNEKDYSLYDLEVLRALMNIKLDYTIKYGVPSYIIDRKEVGDIDFHKEKYTKKEIKELGGKKQVGYMPYTMSDIDEIIGGRKKILKPGDSDSIYTYHCSSKTGVLFSILHYLIMNKYKITTCKHCGGKFFTTNKRRYLCNRITTYEYLKEVRKEKDKLNEKTCVEAVDMIRQRFTKRKCSIYDSFSHQRKIEDEEHPENNYDPKEARTAFNKDATVLAEKMKHEPSHENIREYEEFLYIRNRKKFRKSRTGY